MSFLEQPLPDFRRKFKVEASSVTCNEGLQTLAADLLKIILVPESVICQDLVGFHYT